MRNIIRDMYNAYINMIEEGLHSRLRLFTFRNVDSFFLGREELENEHTQRLIPISGNFLLTFYFSVKRKIHHHYQDCTLRGDECVRCTVYQCYYAFMFITS